VTVVAVVDRDRGPEVLLEAASRAEELGTDVHAVYVLALGRLATLELTLSERVGIPVGLDLIRERCRRIADEVAGEVLEEYEPVGLLGVPEEEILAYAESVDADRIVVDGRANWHVDAFNPLRDTEEGLRAGEIPIVPVY